MSTVLIVAGIAAIVWFLHLIQRDQSELVHALLDVHPDDGDDWPGDDDGDDPDNDTPSGGRGYEPRHVTRADTAGFDLDRATERTLTYARGPLDA